MVSVAPVTVFISVYRFTSSDSHTMSVSTAPISKHASVSATPKTNLPVSCEISSKNLEIRRFSWTNLTLARASAESSMAWLKPFSPPGLRKEGKEKKGGKGEFSFPFLFF